MRIIPRSEWGARFASAYLNRDAPLPAQETWLHHSVTIAPDVNPPFDDDYAAIRTIEEIGQNRFGWGISYTFLVTPSGNVFEGHRINGQGTHTGGRNDIARGICLVGNYDILPTTVLQELNVAELLAHGYRSGWWDSPELNGGHRDLKATACPGNHAYSRISAINAIARDLFMADSDLVRDMANRVKDFLTKQETQQAGPSAGMPMPMVTDLTALMWRVEALVKGRTHVINGPTGPSTQNPTGEPVELNIKLNQVLSNLEELLSR